MKGRTMRIITRAEYEARIKTHLAENYPGTTIVTFDAAIVLSEDEYVED